MSDWNDLFGIEEKKKDTNPLEKKEKIQRVPGSLRMSRTAIPKIPQMNNEKLVGILSQVLDVKLQNLTTMLENQLIIEPVQSSKEFNRHKFSQKNLIWRIGTKGDRGTKLYELRDFFFPTDAQTIKELVDTLFNEEIVKKNRNGWLSLTEKGKHSF